MRKFLTILLTTLLLVCLSTINTFADSDDKEVNVLYSVPAHITLTDSDNEYTQEVEIGQKIEDPGHVTPKGKIFEGYFYNNGVEDIKWDFDTMTLSYEMIDVDSNFKLFAKYIDKEDKIVDGTVPESNFMKASLKFDAESIPLTAEDIELLEDGETMVIVLNVEELTNPPEIDKEAIDNLAKSIKKQVTNYFEVKLLKTIDGNTTEIDETNGRVKVTITIPKELYKSIRQFSIIRTHDDGEGGLLTKVIFTGKATRKNSTYTISFYTDKFSTYALAYRDIQPTPYVPVDTGIGSDTILSPYTLTLLAVLFVITIPMLIYTSKKKKI